MAEAPTSISAPSFRIESSKPAGKLERAKHYFSKEGRQERRAKKTERMVQKQKERAAQKKYSQAEMQKMRYDRQQQGGKYLNMTEHPTFARKRADLRAAALTGGSLQSEVLGNERGKLTPSEYAQIDEQAYEQFKQAHPDLIQQCKATDLYFTPPDKNGNQRIDFRADPWMRTVDAQAHADPDQASQIYAQFCAECPDKAKVYALLGHKGLAAAIPQAEAGRVAGDLTPDTSAATTGGTIAQETVNFQEQKANNTKAEIQKMVDQASADRSTLTARQLNELKQLEKKHAPMIVKARELMVRINDPAGEPLDDAELALLEPYEAFLKAETPDATVGNQTTVAAGTPTTPDAQARADQAKLEQAIRTQGAQIIGELKARGVDISTMSEKVAIEMLRDKKIANPDGSAWQDDANTREYIHHAYVEQQKQLAEAVVAKISQDQIDALVPGKKLTSADLLQLIAMLIATGAYTTGKDALTAAATT